MFKPQESPMNLWRKADAEARAAERRLQRAWDDYEAGHAAVIPVDILKRVTVLRAEANERLTEAVAALNPPDRPSGPTGE
jgi:hypothetical protein